MDFIIAIIMSVIVFSFLFAAVKKNMKNLAQNAPRGKKPNKPTVGNAGDDPFMEDSALAAEGMPTVRKVRKNDKPKPATVVQPTSVEEENEDIDNFIPDFTDDEEMRKAVITSEIINRKYQ